MLISVAVPVPSLDLLTYRVPDDDAPPSVGARVVVPLGARTVTGIVGDEVGQEVQVWNGNGNAYQQLLKL